MSEARIRNRSCAIVLDGDKILLVQHEKYGARYWLLPGGGVDFGETLAEAAQREMREETNLEVAIGRLLFVSESIPPDRHRHVINYYFEAKLTGGELQLGDDPYLVDVQWHRIEDLPHLDLRPHVGQTLCEWIQSGTLPPTSLGNIWQ